jgi:hypothetical protein
VDAPQSSIALSWPEDATTDLVEDFIGIVRGRTVNSTRGRGQQPPAEPKAERAKPKAGGAAPRKAGSGGAARGRAGGAKGGARRGTGGKPGKPRRRS